MNVRRVMHEQLPGNLLSRDSVGLKQALDGNGGKAWESLGTGGGIQRRLCSDQGEEWGGGYSEAVDSWRKGVYTSYTS